MECVGTITLQGVHLASSTRLNLDGRPPAPAGVDERVFLPSLCQESGNCAAPLHGVSRCSSGLAVGK
jgi:hypothetical protein